MRNMKPDEIASYVDDLQEASVNVMATKAKLRNDKKTAKGAKTNSSKDIASKYLNLKKKKDK